MPKTLRRFATRLTGQIVFEYTLRTLARSKGSRGDGPIALVGFFSGSSGVALSVQLASRALDQLDIPHRRLDIGDIAVLNDPGDRSASAWIFYVNPPELMPLLFRWDATSLKGPRYGHWAWELPLAPKAWRRAVQAMDGVMAQSTYTAKAFEPALVTVTPHPIIAEGFDITLRRKARCADDPFLVVSLFDFNSSAARKNPAGALAAFNQAFSNDPKARLIFKTQNALSAPDLFRSLQQKAGSNVEFIDAVWSHAHVLALISSADTLISLHRAEGFGLTLAEAMLLETPVIATNWSGNLDFMNSETSYLVPSSLIALDDPQGIYRGQKWADPDVGAAADHLINLRNNPELAASKARRARTVVERKFNAKTWIETLPDGLRVEITAE